MEVTFYLLIMIMIIIIIIIITIIVMTITIMIMIIVVIMIMIRWANGHDLGTYQNWAAGSPNGHEAENCANINRWR